LVITAHGEKTLTLHDGERDYQIRHDAFDWMKPFNQGGVHPGVTENHEGYLVVASGLDLTGCPVTPLGIDHPHPLVPGKTITVTYLPIKAWLQATYGPDDQIVSVPINGDAAAQRLHWLKRNDAERAEMKAVRWRGRAGMSSASGRTGARGSSSG
jgi:hypothetical protein